MLRDCAISYRPARFAQEDARAKKPIRQTSIRGRSACLRLNSPPRRLLPLNIKELYLYGTNMYAYYNR